MTSTGHRTPTVVVADVATPVGTFRVASLGPDGAVVAAAFDDGFDAIVDRVSAQLGDATWTEGESAAGAAVAEWVAGDLHALDGLAVDPPGTDWQQRVWAGLRAIPVGETRGYGDLAVEIGAAGSARAVGSANGANPVWLIVPCHRVVRSDGALGGYAGGVARKAWLLGHEGAR